MPVRPNEGYCMVAACVHRCGQHRLAALYSQNGTVVRFIRNNVPFIKRGVVRDKADEHGDGLEPRGRTDRRVRADAQRNIDTMLQTPKAVVANSRSAATVIA